MGVTLALTASDGVYRQVRTIPNEFFKQILREKTNGNDLSSFGVDAEGNVVAMHQAELELAA